MHRDKEVSRSVRGKRIRKRNKERETVKYDKKTPRLKVDKYD